MDGWELRGWGEGSVLAGQGNHTIQNVTYSIAVQYRETALLWTPIEASVLINYYKRGILTMYGAVDHMTLI